MHSEHLLISLTDGATLAAVFLIGHLLSNALVRGRSTVRPAFWSLMVNAARNVDRKLNRPERSMSELSLRGIVATVTMALMGVTIGFAVSRVSSHEYGWIAVLLFMGTCVTALGPMGLMRRIVAHLEKDEIKKAINLLQPFFHEDLADADQYTVIRKTLEFSAIKLCQYFVAPLMWFMLLHTQGLALYVTVAAMHEAFGTDDPRHMVFGGLVRGLEKILDFIPARITAAFIVFAALFVSKSNPFRGFATAMEQQKHYRSLNRGWLIAAQAGALGVTLGGPIKHNDKTIERDWVGPKGSSARPGVAELKRGTMLHFVVYLCIFCIVLLLMAGGY